MNFIALFVYLTELAESVAHHELDVLQHAPKQRVDLVDMHKHDLEGAGLLDGLLVGLNVQVPEHSQLLTSPYRLYSVKINNKQMTYHPHYSTLGGKATRAHID